MPVLSPESPSFFLFTRTFPATSSVWQGPYSYQIESRFPEERQSGWEGYSDSNSGTCAVTATADFSTRERPPWSGRCAQGSSDVGQAPWKGSDPLWEVGCVSVFPFTFSCVSGCTSCVSTSLHSACVLTMGKSTAMWTCPQGLCICALWRLYACKIAYLCVSWVVMVMHVFYAY